MSKKSISQRLSALARIKGSLFQLCSLPALLVLKINMHSLSSSLSSASSSSFSTHSSSFSQEALSDGDPCKMDGSRPVLPRKKADGNMYPRRGAIKAKIFRAVVKCIIALASELGKGRRRKKGDPGAQPVVPLL